MGYAVSIWCPVCGKKGERTPRVQKDGFFYCGKCDTQIVNVADEGCCVACGKDARGKWTCENCHQWVCGRHIEKRNCYGFAIRGCPNCFAISIPKDDYPKDKKEIIGDYTAFRFVYNKEKGWYEWDKDLSRCYFDKYIIPRRKALAVKIRKELEIYRKENSFVNCHEIRSGFDTDLQAVNKWLKQVDEL